MPAKLKVAAVGVGAYLIARSLSRYVLKSRFFPLVAFFLLPDYGWPTDDAREKSSLTDMK